MAHKQPGKPEGAEQPQAWVIFEYTLMQAIADGVLHPMGWAKGKPAIQRQIQDIPEFTECDKVTGEDCFVARLSVHSMEQLDAILDKLADRAETNTSIVKATPVKRRLPPLVRSADV